MYDWSHRKLKLIKLTHHPEPLGFEQQPVSEHLLEDDENAQVPHLVAV